MDRRLTPENERVAAMHLRGQVDAARFVEGEVKRVIVPMTDLNRTSLGPRDRQLLIGEAATVYETRDGWSFVQSQRDSYVGYVVAKTLGDTPAPTHWVTTPATHAYSAEDFKAPEVHHLGFGSQVTVVDERRKFFETTEGWFIPKKHLWPLTKKFADPVIAAQLHFGTPYLWGGNSICGIDCSGLVQAALLAAGLQCPGDSDLQQALGEPLADDMLHQRGDLIFWKGHVGMMVDSETLIHANAHHMAVAYEPLAAAITRIKAQGDGPVTARKRLID